MKRVKYITKQYIKRQNKQQINIKKCDRYTNLIYKISSSIKNDI